MASIESLGIGSGVLNNDLVDNIINAERASADLRMDVKTARIEARISAYGALKSSLDKLSSATTSLSLPSTISKTKVTSSDSSLISGSSISNAQTGTFNFNVTEIAKAHSLASKQYTSITDTVGIGTLSFKFGTTSYDGGGAYLGFVQQSDSNELSITIDSGNNTLSGIRDAINKSNSGVTASIINDGGGYRLLFSSSETGEDFGMEITVSGDAGLQSLAYNASQNDPTSNMMMTQSAQDASLTVNGLAITSATNSLTEVIKGVTINISNETAGKDITLSIKQDTSGLADKINGFLEAYNEYKTIYNELTSYDPDKELGGILLGDSTLRSIQNQVRSTLSSMVEGITDGNVRSLAEIGITTDQFDDFKLRFNQSKFESVLNAQAASVTALMSSSVEPTDSLISYLTRGSDTIPGDYDIEITQAATQGQSIGKTVSGFDFLSPVTVGGSNDSFRIDVDGVTATIALDQGDYATGDDLALMLQTSINSNSTISGKGKSITVEFNAIDKRMEFTSTTFGSSSRVSFSALDATVSNTLGIIVPGQGEVNGAYFTSLNDMAFGASTLPATQAVTSSADMDFSTDSMTFDLTLAGTAASDGLYSITLDQDIGDIYDTDGNLTTDRDRGDVLSYINSELVSQGLSGLVSAEFNSSDRLVFSMVTETGSQTLTLSNVVAARDDLLGLAGSAGSTTSGVAVPAGTTFEVAYSNRYGAVTSGTVTVPAATYETGDDIATAIQTAINADVTVLAGASGAETEKGSVDFTNPVDFTSDPAAIEFDWGGSSYILDVAANGADNLASINAAITAIPALAGNIVATMDNGGIILSTTATGSAQSIQVTKDGGGDKTIAGTVDISAGFDFSVSASAFSLQVDGQSIDVTLDQDAGTSTAEVVAYIQQELDTALAATGGGGEFASGDIVVKDDGAGHIYFETASKNGSRTDATFGALAAIEITATDANTIANLGLAIAGPVMAGRDEFGIALGNYVGFDSQSTVSYQQNADGLGRFSISMDNETTIQILNPTTTTSTVLGLDVPNGTESTVVAGLDVEGTINGVEASGRGQYLTASEGSDKATNGYLLGSPGADFTAPVTIDGTNNTLKLTIDGITTNTITLTNGVYTSGEALIADLESQINADTNLKALNKTVDVQYDAATSIFGIFSTETGKNSTVDVTEITTGGATIFGMTINSTGVKGSDAIGTSDPAAGLMLKVLGSQTGSRGSVSFVQGIFDKLTDIFDNLLKHNGVVPSRLANLDGDMEEIAAEKERIDQRISATERRLKAQFLFNDKIISSLKLTENFLTQQFEAMIASQKS